MSFLAMAGLNLLSSIYQNQAVEATAESNYASSVERAEREAMSQRGQLMTQARENSMAVNQERYNLQREGMRERASESVATAEGGFSGVLAQRMKSATNITEGVQDSTITINEGLEQDALNAKAMGVAQGKIDRIANAQTARHNTLSQRTGGLGLVTGALGAGAQGSQIAGSLGYGNNTKVNKVK